MAPGRLNRIARSRSIAREAPARGVRGSEPVMHFHRDRCRILMIVALLVVLSGHATAQGAKISYAPIQLNCARFLEIGQSAIHTEAGGRTRRQTSARRGTWQFRAGPSAAGVEVEGWLDSLTITRRSPEAAISPDTDGLLGGRYRGTLSPTGEYTAQIHPFVPDEVAEVAGMATALNDFFPQVPPRVLKHGEIWSNSTGLSITRLPDSVASGVSLYRFELQREGKAQTAPSPSDTLELDVQQKSRENGRFVWHPQLGMLRRERDIVIETTVPPSRTVRQAVRSRVEQRVTLVRDLRPTDCRRSGG
jgi:hypothetical protein